jgi:hypothetical protein
MSLMVPWGFFFSFGWHGVALSTHLSTSHLDSKTLDRVGCVSVCLTPPDPEFASSWIIPFSTSLSAHLYKWSTLISHCFRTILH